MTDMTKYFITGATGHLGKKVVAELAKLTSPANIRLGIHNPIRLKLSKIKGLS